MSKKEKTEEELKRIEIEPEPEFYTPRESTEEWSLKIKMDIPQMECPYCKKTRILTKPRANRNWVGFVSSSHCIHCNAENEQAVFKPRNRETLDMLTRLYNFDR